MIRRCAALLTVTLICLASPLLDAQDKLVPAPDRRAGEGAGPFPTRTIRNVMVIDGTELSRMIRRTPTEIGLAVPATMIGMATGLAIRPTTAQRRGSVRSPTLCSTDST